MKDHGLGSWTRRRARMTPDKVALVQDGRGTTYAEVHRDSTRLANGLSALGIERGDRVAFLGLNSIELVTTMFATARLGAVFVPLNTRLAPPELAYILDHSGATHLIVEDGFTVPETVPSADQALAVHRFTRAGGRGLDHLRSEDDTEIDEPVDLDDPFMIQYTSGTTGRPKGVLLTHGNVTWNVYNLLVDIDLTSEETALVTAPLFHTAALNQLLFPTFLKGGRSLIEAKFDPARAIDMIESDRVSVLFGVTSMYLALAATERFAEADLSSLRLALSGGAPIPESVLRTWVDRGLMIVQGYGLTEASPGATMLRVADGIRKLGSAGTACFFTDVRLDDLGDEVAPGEPGEVLVSGPNVTPGYWRDEAATAGAFTGEWLHTGDLAILDDEGYFRVVDRLKDMYISGGENVYPVEVEQALYSHPAVAECAVVGVPDAVWGEVGRAFVVLRPEARIDAAALVAYLETRLARYKLPKSVVFVPDLPHNASGKLTKAPLRDVAP